MNIGEKIKKLRTEKMMTQSELSGGVITRNMLSSIENGTALPSLATLKHISNKLNVPAGYLLAEGDDEQIYVKFNEILDIKRAYASKNYRICRDMCLNAGIDDDEVTLILAECSLALGVEHFKEGCLRMSCAYFDEAIEAAERTIYNAERIVAVAASYFRYMRRISATLGSDVIDENEIHIFSALSDIFSCYTSAFDFIEDGDREMTEYFFTLGLDRELPYGLHIGAKADMLDKNYFEAHRKLYRILTNPYKIEEPLMYFVFCDLEICCKELNDFKGAYEYSNAKLGVLQKMLTE